MKLYGNKGSVVDSSRVMNASAFSIARTPHMFNILSNSLYSDKIAAVLREIGCNAVDAHIMAGKPELPIEVKLPTELDPSFYIKDWGPGLDHEEVTKLYTTYGWSNKQNSDEVTGAFGLGSKSPFAYTLQNANGADGFTVEAAKNGIKRIYTCYLNEEGVPSAAQLYEGPSEDDWPSGVKVTFPVQADDIPVFHDKAAEIYSWFAVKPCVLGLDSCREELVRHGLKFAYEGPDFKLFPDELVQSVVRTFSTSTSVVMAGVRYPVRLDKLYSTVPKEIHLLCQAGLHLWVPTGEISITPSREELEYAPATIAALKNRIQAAYGHFYEILKETVLLHAKESVWQQAQALIARARSIAGDKTSETSALVREIILRLRNEGVLSSLVANVLRENGVSLTKGYCKLYRADRPDGTRQAYAKKVVGGLIESSRTTSLSDREIFIKLDTLPRVVYLDDDSLKFVDARLRAFVLGLKGNSYVFYFGTEHSNPLEAAQNFLRDNGLEGLPLVKLSELPEPTKAKRLSETKEQRLNRMLSEPVEVLVPGGKRVMALKDIPENQRYYVVRVNKSTKELRRDLDFDLLSIIRFNRGYLGPDLKHSDVLMAYAKEYLPHLPQHMILLTPQDEKRFQKFLTANYLNTVARHFVDTYDSRNAGDGRFDVFFRAHDNIKFAVENLIRSGFFGFLFAIAEYAPDLWSSFVRESGNAELALDIEELVRAYRLSTQVSSRNVVEANMAKMFIIDHSKRPVSGGDFRYSSKIADYFSEKYPALSLVRTIDPYNCHKILKNPAKVFMKERLRIKLMVKAAMLDAEERARLEPELEKAA